MRRLPHSAPLWPAVFQTVFHSACSLPHILLRSLVCHTIFHCGLQSSTQCSTVACCLPHSAPVWPAVFHTVLHCGLLSSTQCYTVACSLPHSAQLWPAVFHTVLYCGLKSSTQCSTVVCSLPHSAPLWPAVFHTVLYCGLVWLAVFSLQTRLMLVIF